MVMSLGVNIKLTGETMTGKFRGPGSLRNVLTGSVAVFTVAFCAAFASSSVFTPTRSSDATNNTVTANITRAQYYVKMKASDVEFDLESKPTGAMTVANSTIKTTTNAPTGYKLYLGMSEMNSAGQEKSAADKLKNGLYLDEDLSSGSVIPAAPGTATTPVALDQNTWGYAVDKDSTGAPDVWKSLNHTAMTSATPTSDAFAAVPGVGSEELIQETTTRNTEIPEDEWTEEDWEDSSKYTAATVWYGAVANMAVETGAYSNTIAYTAITQFGPTPGGDLSFSPMTYARNDRYDDATWNDTLTITSSLFVPVDTDLGDVTITLTGGPENDSHTCGDAVGTVVPIEEGATSGYAAFTCTLPKAYAGDYTVSVEVPRYGVTYTGNYKYVVTWSTISAMQEMTKDVCLSAGNVTVNQRTKSNPVPEVFLEDLRGGGGHVTGNNVDGYTYSATQTGQYRVRKLADQHCWMTENLELEMSTGTALHPYDTNIAANWTPTTNTITTPGQTVVSGDDTVDRTYHGNGSEGTATVTTEDSVSTTGYAQETQGIGMYYSWGAAVAGQGATATGSVLNSSVCPKGWRLPSGEGDAVNGSFAYLMKVYDYTAQSDGSSAARSYPLSYTQPGVYYWGDATLYRQGQNGFWWSYTNKGSEYKAISLSLGNTSIATQYDGLQKYYGTSIRCLAEF